MERSVIELNRTHKKKKKKKWTSAGQVKSLKGAIFEPFIWSEMASSSSVSDDSEEERIISYFFSRGYTYEVISEFFSYVS